MGRRVTRLLRLPARAGRLRSWTRARTRADGADRAGGAGTAVAVEALPRAGQASLRLRDVRAARGPRAVALRARRPAPPPALVRGRDARRSSARGACLHDGLMRRF